MTATENKEKGFPFIYIILFAAAVIRLINLSSLSFSNDELSALIRTRFSSLGELVEKGVYIDYHPAGVQLFLYYWTAIFGESVFVVRLPFVLFGLGSIWLIYAIGKKWYNEFTGLAAAAFFAFLPLTITYNQFARMYSPGIFFCLLACYGWMNYLFFSGEKKYGWIWAFAMTACLHIHYFAFAFVGLLGITGLFFLRQTNWKFYLLCGLFSLLTFGLEWKIFMEQMKTGDIGGWLAAPDSDFILQFFWDVLNHSGVLVAVMGGLLLYGIFTPVSEKSRWRLFCLFWFTLSFLIAYIYSVMGHPVIQNSTLLFTWPFFLLAIFSFIPDRVVEGKKGLLITVVLSVFLIGNTVASGFYTTPRFGVFKELADDIERFREEKGERIPFVVNVINADYYRYYQSDKRDDKYNTYKVEQPADLSALMKKVNESSSQYFGYAWSNSLHPDEIVSIISMSYPYLVYKRNGFNHAVYLFSKREKEKQLPFVYEEVCDFEKKNWGFGDVTTEHSFSQPNGLLFETDFSPGIQKFICELPGKGCRILEFSAMFLPVSKLTEIQLVISIDRAEKNIYYKSVRLNEFSKDNLRFSRAILAFSLPDDVFPKDILKAYLYNPMHDTLYLDDLRFSVREEDDPYKPVF